MMCYLPSSSTVSPHRHFFHISPYNSPTETPECLLFLALKGGYSAGAALDFPAAEYMAAMLLFKNP